MIAMKRGAAKRADRAVRPYEATQGMRQKWRSEGTPSYSLSF